MPALIGNIQILNVAGSATVNFGDTGFISPKSAAKETFGSNGGANGVVVINFSAISINNTFNKSILDQPITGNN